MNRNTPERREILMQTKATCPYQNGEICPHFDMYRMVPTKPCSICDKKTQYYTCPYNKNMYCQYIDTSGMNKTQECSECKYSK